MNKLYYDIIIVGAGIAGVSAIKTIRKNNSEVSILLISNEDRLPYKRTKVNKHMAIGFSKNDFRLFKAEWYSEHNVDLVFGTANNLNTELKTLTLNNKHTYSFGKLLITTGAEPTIPEITGIHESDIMLVHYAKTVEDLRLRLNKMKKLLIIGGGVEGIETAYELHRLGKEVIIVDSKKNTLERLFPNYISDEIYNSIDLSKIQYFHETRIKHIDKKGEQYALRINENEYVVDGIIACAGTRPNTKLALQAGLVVHKGIRVNEYMQTSHPDIYAAGDVAEHNNGWVTGLWHPADYQGLNAGLNMSGLKYAYKPVPLRLKTSVFDGFYFTANYFEKQSRDVECHKFRNNSICGELFTRNEKIVGIVMMNDEERSKLYYKLLGKKADLDEFRNTFPDLKIT